jgi:hypothetical protein
VRIRRIWLITFRSSRRQIDKQSWINQPGPRFVSVSIPPLLCVADLPFLTQLPQSKSLVYIDNDLNKSTPATSRANSPENVKPEESKDGSTNGMKQDKTTSGAIPSAAKVGPAKINIAAQNATAQAPMSFHSHLQGSAVSDTSFVDEHHAQQQQQHASPIPAARAPMNSPSATTYASSPRRNQYTGITYNGISAGVIPVENLGKSPVSPSAIRQPGSSTPGSQSLAGQHGFAPGAVGLAGVNQRGPRESFNGEAPEVHAEADEYYGGKEVWSRSRTYSNVGPSLHFLGFLGADVCFERPVSWATVNDDPNKWTKRPSPETEGSRTMNSLFERHDGS